MPSLTRRATAELVGTFAFVFIGAGSVLTSRFGGTSFGVLGIAIAHGLALSIFVTATMNISGGHLNPAVTAGFLVTRRIKLLDAGVYVLAQLVGATIGAFLLKFLFPGDLSRITALGAPMVAGSVTASAAMGIEAVLTFFLVSAVFGTILYVNAPKVGGFGVGLVVVFAILVGGPLTGAAMNPARAFGPSLASGVWVGHAIYWIGPIVGGVVAALLWDLVLMKEPKGSQ